MQCNIVKMQLSDSVGVSNIDEVTPDNVYRTRYGAWPTELCTSVLPSFTAK